MAGNHFYKELRSSYGIHPTPVQNGRFASPVSLGDDPQGLGSHALPIGERKVVACGSRELYISTWLNSFRMRRAAMISRAWFSQAVFRLESLYAMGEIKANIFLERPQTIALHPRPERAELCGDILVNPTRNTLTQVPAVS